MTTHDIRSQAGRPDPDTDEPADPDAPDPSGPTPHAPGEQHDAGIPAAPTPPPD